MTFSFAGRTVLVAGAHGGIGRRAAELFARCGGAVHACDNHPDFGAASFGPSDAVATRSVDLTDETAVADYVGTVERTAPADRIDVLLYAAGGVCGQVERPIETVSTADFRAIIDANAIGLLHLLRAAAPAMKRGGGGRVIVVSSRAGLGISRTGIQSYTFAKAGQIALVRHLAKELGPHGVTVNAIAPGFMTTNDSSRRQWEGYGPDGRQALIDGLFIKRIGRPEDIGHAALFFASDYAGWITGQTLTVAGVA